MAAMGNGRPLLMIPGPIEISPAVQAAFSVPPPGHLAPRVIEAFGRSLGLMRKVWLAGADAQPFVVPGSGTTAMEMAVWNVVSPHDSVVVVKTGYFSDRMETMLARAGARVTAVGSEPGHAPTIEEVRSAVDAATPKALFATHVDTSTGVRVDPEPLARLARERGILSVFDGVCATAGERFAMEAWGADVVFTASQKAIGLPPGLGLLVATPRALEARDRRAATPPPMALDFAQWLPIMKAYEAGRPSYFATPATNLILALETGLAEILADGMEARFALHARAARAMREAWRSLGLEEVPARDELRANTLSALWYPEGVGAELLARIAARGVVVAGGLHAAIRDRYFRVGHMGYAATVPEMLRRTAEAVGEAVLEAGHPGRAISPEIWSRLLA
jgi:alanine-glyoxylate transaminase/serine-glyoxylate transaminase/serine-pyruvate transaminase